MCREVPADVDCEYPQNLLMPTIAQNSNFWTYMRSFSSQAVTTGMTWSSVSVLKILLQALALSLSLCRITGTCRKCKFAFKPYTILFKLLRCSRNKNINKISNFDALSEANFKGTHTAIETRMNNITKCGTEIEIPECAAHSYS
jgi:hypothetical protein